MQYSVDINNARLDAVAQIAWQDFYAELLREERRRLIDAEIAWRMQALLEEQDEEQAVLLLLAEM